MESVHGQSFKQLPSSNAFDNPKQLYKCDGCGKIHEDQDTAYLHIIDTGHASFWYHKGQEYTWQRNDPNMKTDTTLDSFEDPFGTPSVTNSRLEAARDAPKTMQESALAINNSLTTRPTYRKKRASSHEREQHERERHEREQHKTQSLVRDATTAASSPQENTTNVRKRVFNSYTNEEWKKHRPLITKMYSEDGRTLKNIRDLLAREFDFTPT
jgi:hypothetical protein